MATKKNGSATRRRAVAAGPEYVFDEVPVPKPEDARGGKRIYFPFGEMEVGRSFTTKRALDTLRSAIIRYRSGGKADQEFKVRDVPGAGCRVWRTK